MARLGAVDLRELAGDIVREIEQWAGRMSLTDWIMLTLGAAAVAWFITWMLARTRLGPIEVTKLEADENNDATKQVSMLTATIGRRLYRAGLSGPAGAPAGAPRADILTAVETSPVPQANWIASLLKLVPFPRPRAYTVGGAASNPGEIGFWVRPVHKGGDLQDIVERDSLEDAAERVADLAYLHIIEDAVYQLPLWARWSDADALDAYMKARKELETGNDLDAALWLNAAATGERTNLLVQILFANLIERTTSDSTAPLIAQRAIRHARSLDAYLRVSRPEPTVVEARYRTSVIAAMLADSITQIDQQYRNRVRTELTMISLPADGPAAKKVLIALSRNESWALLALLRPWYALTREHRLRHQLELQGVDRRRLRNTVRIARHCIWLRESPRTDRKLARPRAALRELHVRWLLLGRVGWQAHYNAACFYALLRGWVP
jgi:hypothetical protein